MKDLLFNGKLYTPVPDPGPEGEAIRGRWEGVEGTIVTKLDGQPAILHQGEFYRQSGTLIPGVDWDRVKQER